MSGYWIFGFGAFIGALGGFLIAAMLGAAHSGDRQHELWQAYQDGYGAGQGRPGCSLAGVAEAKVQGK